MGLVAIEILPLESAWDECPARGVVSKVVSHSLRPIDLGWPEHWIEAFLAEQPEAIPACLGVSLSKPIVWRQLADIDLVFLATDEDTAILVELKKQTGCHAKDAVRQLARNIGRAKRMLRSHGKTSLRAIACGTWGPSQLARAQDTVAWNYLKEQGVSPEFVLYSGAVSEDGRRYLVLSSERSPFARKGKALEDAGFADLRIFARQLSGELPPGLSVGLYRLDGAVIVRFAADSKVRDLYLGSKLGTAPTGSVGAFLAVQSALAKSGVDATPIVGQRLELRLEVKSGPAGDVSRYSGARTLLSEIASFAKEGAR